jgi:hypothetical protein
MTYKTKICVGCGKEFEVWWRNKKNRFCSLSCSKIGAANPNWQGKVAKFGADHPGWKGDRVGLDALHVFIHRRLPKPDKCQCCGLVPPVDLANISNEYKRDISDWEWLCRRCHMNKDGRLAKLIENSKKATERRKNINNV